MPPLFTKSKPDLPLRNMAEAALRSRDQPDIRARISIHDNESPNEIKELLLAVQTQKALRSTHSWTPPEAVGSLHRVALRKARTLPYPYRPGHFSDIPASDALPCPINRSNSLNSLSTIQRETEAAALSLHRGSPISAIGPSYAAPSWSIDSELQDPCTPRLSLHVETLSQQAKHQKRLRKNLKKEEKIKRKAEKADEEIRRAALAAEIAASRKARGETIPMRTKSTRSIASQVVKGFSLKSPLSKLTRHVRRDRSDPPTLDDFDSKSAIREYFNQSSPPMPPSPPLSAAIAELPAELPQYTPFQDLTRSQDNEPITLLDGNPAKQNTASPVEVPNLERAVSQPKARSMRCDSCQSPIRLNQVYYHCSICDSGDRILCCSCDQAGWSCRHDLTERVRIVSRPDSSDRPNASTLVRERSQSEATQYATGMRAVKVSVTATQSRGCAESPSNPTMSAADPWVSNDKAEQNRLYDAEHDARQGLQRSMDDSRKSDSLQRERELAFREKELTLRERETNIREHRASVREQEATLHVKQQLFSLRLQSTIAKQTTELSQGVGAQFQDVARLSTRTQALRAGHGSNIFVSECGTDNVRTHATKRKAGAGPALVSPANSTGSNNKTPMRRSPSDDQEPDDENEDASGGTPKKIKPDPDALQTHEKLFACPFCKYDKSKYSEQNVQEKQYRGCSSGYWPDISRLKQHLYRVHWRRIHCTRCYARFDRKDQLDQHRRASISCALVECPYPEKFDETQYNDIRRKRPASTPEQVWYTIFSILFPSLPQPATPYSDNVDVASAASPGTAEGQDTMDVLGEVFESRLNQLTSLPGQGWLQSAEARNLIREQLRASMADVLQRIRPSSSHCLGNPSVEVSPISAEAPDSARRSSICLTTPASSVPASPVTGPGSVNRSGSDAHFLLPGHRTSFSRPFSARTVPKLSSPKPAPRHQNFEQSGVTFPVPLAVDPEDDRYDEECDSWSHGDERGLAISTDTMPVDFEFDFATAFDDLQKPDTKLTAATIPNYNPVKLTSLNDLPDQKLIEPADLKAKHSTSSSVDSGYGSLGHASSSASAAAASSAPTPFASPVKNANSKPATRRTGLNKGKQKVTAAVAKMPAKPSSPVPDFAINYDALEESFQEFSGMNLDLNMDEHFGRDDALDFDGWNVGRRENGNVNVGATALSTYLDGRYPRGAREPG